MKKLLLILFLCLTPFITEAQQKTVDNRIITEPAGEEHLLDNKIYFFAHSMCMNCKDPFIYLAQNHADLNIPITDMKFRRNFELYKECVQKFNIPNNELRLPLICMGDNYIMGWDETAPARFREYLKIFQNKEQTADVK